MLVALFGSQACLPLLATPRAPDRHDDYPLLAATAARLVPEAGDGRVEDAVFDAGGAQGHGTAGTRAWFWHLNNGSRDSTLSGPSWSPSQTMEGVKFDPGPMVI